MPTSYQEIYFPVLLQAVIALAVAAGLIGISYLLGHRVKNAVKDLPYECGITPVGNAKERFSVKFYLVAMMFIVFDIEAIFLFPWAVVYDELKLYAFIVMLIFLYLILSGLLYIYRKGVLDWALEKPEANPGAATRP
jgi:NADH-quinone oxidoreductase subunit A